MKKWQSADPPKSKFLVREGKWAQNESEMQNSQWTKLKLTLTDKVIIIIMPKVKGYKN